MLSADVLTISCQLFALLLPSWTPRPGALRKVGLRKVVVVGTYRVHNPHLQYWNRCPVLLGRIKCASLNRHLSRLPPCFPSTLVKLGSPSPTLPCLHFLRSTNYREGSPAPMDFLSHLLSVSRPPLTATTSLPFTYTSTVGVGATPTAPLSVSSQPLPASSATSCLPCLRLPLGDSPLHHRRSYTRARQ